LVRTSARDPGSMLDSFFQRLWYAEHARWAVLLLLPLSGLFALIASVRRAAYSVGLFRSHRVDRPVLVVGNITVGGVGKTPLTIWLAFQLASRGVRVGIILRGYGGRSPRWPRHVNGATPVEEVGDEAALLAQRTSAIVVAGPDRVADAQLAIELGAEVVLSDDGLQHYRLARDCEIAVIDAQRGLGNGRLLPAGPLREGRTRLGSVDLVVLTRRTTGKAEPTNDLCVPGSVTASARLTRATCLATGEVRSLEAFKGGLVHAIAAIGHPQAFFDSLAAWGLNVDSRALPDHAALTPADVSFGDEAPVLMTEKDAVKCRTFADRRLWAVRMDVEMDAEGAAAVSGLIDRLLLSRPAVA
jgi:tetraacyldisaccharide 4'-kinase